MDASEMWQIPPLPFGRAPGWNGLKDGQDWNIPPGPRYRAVVDASGFSSVVSRALYKRAEYRAISGVSRAVGGWKSYHKSMRQCARFNYCKASGGGRVRLLRAMRPVDGVAITRSWMNSNTGTPPAPAKAAE